MHAQEGRITSNAQIYLYDPEEDISRVNICWGQIHLNNNISDNEKRVLNELLNYFEEIPTLQVDWNSKSYWKKQLDQHESNFS